MNKQLGYLSLRALLGLNIGMHGVSRILTGPSLFAHTMTQQFSATPLPAKMTYLFALCLPWTEAVIGILILFGLATRFTLLLGVLELAALTFGTILRQDWQAASIQLSYALVYALLLASLEFNRLSIDSFIPAQSARDTQRSTPVANGS